MNFIFVYVCVFYLVEQGEPGNQEKERASLAAVADSRIEDKERTKTHDSNRRRIKLVDALSKEQCKTRIKKL